MVCFLNIFFLFSLALDDPIVPVPPDKKGRGIRGRRHRGRQGPAAHRGRTISRRVNRVTVCFGTG